MGQAIPVRTDYTAGEVRRFAQRAKDAAQVRRLLAIAAVLDGASREEAATIGGMCGCMRSSDSRCRTIRSIAPSRPWASRMCRTTTEGRKKSLLRNPECPNPSTRKSSPLHQWRVHQWRVVPSGTSENGSLRTFFPSLSFTNIVQADHRWPSIPVLLSINSRATTNAWLMAAFLSSSTVPYGSVTAFVGQMEIVSGH